MTGELGGSQSMKHALVVYACLALCSGTQATAARPATPSIIVQARKLIAAHMIDPASLQVRNTRIIKKVVQGQSLTIACGEFNSKNRMGGYTGFQAFAYEPTVLKGVLSLGDDSQFSFFGADGGDELSHREVFENAETTGLIYSACLGLKE